MSGFKRTKCEICRVKTCRMDGQKRLFMARFPLDEDRCKQWVAATGNEDLIHVPLEKFNQLKYICGKHFRTKDFKKKKTQLKKNAVPLIDISENPLEDDMFHSFPLHIQYMAKSDTRKNVLSDHNYCSRTGQDPETNINSPKLNALLSQNDEKDLLDVRKSSLGEKTDINFGKHVVESKASRDSGDSNPYVEGIPETYNDVEESSFQDQDLQESQQEPLFSWEKMEVVSADEGDSVACLRQQEALDRLPADISLYCDDDSSSSKPDSGEKAREPEYDDYKCNLCQEFILGFRYTCVQCADFDLCAACEARGAHDAHYVLRVPGHRPYNEIQAVLHALRQQILSENLFLDPIDDRLKEEIKIEPDEAPVDPDKDPVPGVGLPPDIDPLPVTDPLSEQRPESQNTCESSEESDDDSTTYGTDEIFIPSDHSQLQTVSSDDSDASRSPRRKRTRITSPKTYEQHNQTLPLYYIPQKHNPPSTTSHNIIHTPRMPTRFYQTVNIQEHRTETNAQEQTVIVIQEDQELRPTERTVLKEPIVCLNRILDQENFIVIQENQEEIRPRENIAQKEPRVLVPRIDMQLQKQGNHRETILQQLPSSKDHAMLIDQSHQIEIVLDSDDDEPMEIMPENLKNDEQPEFILKLPPNTNEEALIQALQSLVTVRLKRDF